MKLHGFLLASVFLFMVLLPVSFDYPIVENQVKTLSIISPYKVRQVKTEFFDLPVVQQPLHEITFVSSKKNEITQFQTAMNHGVIGLLAHNYLSGEKFYKLEQGDLIEVFFSDGRQLIYVVSGIYEFQKVTPDSLTSDFKDLVNDNIVTSNDIYDLFYLNGGEKVVFQTCLKRDRITNWGLRFITAETVGDEWNPFN